MMFNLWPLLIISSQTNILWSDYSLSLKLSSTHELDNQDHAVDNVINYSITSQCLCICWSAGVEYTQV